MLVGNWLSRGCSEAEEDEEAVRHARFFILRFGFAPGLEQLQQKQQQGYHCLALGILGPF